MPVVIGRLFNTVGPRQSGQYGMVIPRFMQQALLNHPLTVYGDGQQSRCFTHVKDVIKAMIDLMEQDDCIGEIFNIGSNDEIRILDLAKKIIKITNSKSKIKLISYKEAYGEGFEDMKRRIPDLTKISKSINYTQKYNLNNILQEMQEYYKRN